MSHKKGEFPARPPTLAEALYEGKEIGTKPENAEEILKSLNLNVKKDDKKDVKKVVKKDIKKEVKQDKKIVHQVDAHIDTPLPMETESKIEGNYILPNQCEAVTNLQMDYIMRRKSELIKSILKSRVFSSSMIGLLTVIGYYKIGDYFNDYTFKGGLINGILGLFKNGYFVDDLFTLVFIILFLLVTVFSILKFLAYPLQNEGEQVPNNFEKYFNLDLNEYASVDLKKMNKEEKEMVKFTKEYTFSISYRESPVAFMVAKPEGNNIRIIGYGVRKVYIKAELFKDLLQLLLKRFVIESKEKPERISVELYNFEEFDVNIMKRAGFFKEKSENIGFLISTVFGITKDTYVFETDSIEF